MARLSWTLYSDADFLVAGRVLGASALGAYTFAWNLATLPVEKVTALVGQVTPAFFSANQADHWQTATLSATLIEGVPRCSHFLRRLNSLARTQSSCLWRLENAGSCAARAAGGGWHSTGPCARWQRATRAVIDGTTRDAVRYVDQRHSCSGNANRILFWEPVGRSRNRVGMDYCLPVGCNSTLCRSVSQNRYARSEVPSVPYFLR